MCIGEALSIAEVHSYFNSSKMFNIIYFYVNSFHLFNAGIQLQYKRENDVLQL